MCVCACVCACVHVWCVYCVCVCVCVCELGNTFNKTPKNGEHSKTKAVMHPFDPSVGTNGVE